jgi:hypothetical protein
VRDFRLCKGYNPGDQFIASQRSRLIQRLRRSIAWPLPPPRSPWHRLRSDRPTARPAFIKACAQSQVSPPCPTCASTGFRSVVDSCV